ncbi:response regulator [Actinomadura bangladeshensis]|uniref:Response regulator transcription factor n=1 Tax=Actinomadura bangladeshensis TaxID=453573 RepID=A0A4R4PE13_9ACTN|nr:response regulator transcription factor [Actinomadura bangladeshensis]TDC19637.1 response regulator transcription factor [Actinomadura bangladeshensis]
MTIRVLIVDDQELIRIGFRLFLQTRTDLEVVGEAADGHEAIARAAELRPDVVLMDVRMPRMDGVEATARITATDRPAPDEPGSTAGPPRVLILTTYDLDEYVFGALRAGASGFLLKDAPRERLLEAIRVVHQGEALLSPSITRRLIEDYAGRTDPVRPSPDLLTALTPREREMLLLVAQGLSNQEIAARLVVTEATVKSHVGSVFAKLHLRDRVQAVVLAYEHGIVVPGRRPNLQ